FKQGVSMLSIVGDKVWNIYQATTQLDFEQRIAEFREWIATNIVQEYIQQQLYNCCDKAKQLTKAYQFQGCIRTSNAVDRPMRRLDRLLFNMQYFHGHLYQANLLLSNGQIISSTF
ncbi:MAG: hypothetical protein AAGI49_07090, partial [Bacteroidota bacterium]